MAKRRPMIAGNWKMYKTAVEAVNLVQNISNDLDKVGEAEVVVCPPFTALKSVATVIEYDGLNLGLGAQNMHWEQEGAFTGEISPLMLKQLRVDYVIIGHSERRQYFGDTDEAVNRKIKSALANELKVIFCIGESLEQREGNQTNEVVSAQVAKGLDGVAGNIAENIVIAYEPVWAIGTGRVAEPEDANDVIRHIRAVVTASHGNDVAQNVRIIYGGSVKPSNISAIMEEPEIDGALVGGASLTAADFVELIQF